MEYKMTDNNKEKLNFYQTRMIRDEKLRLKTFFKKI